MSNNTIMDVVNNRHDNQYQVYDVANDFAQFYTHDDGDEGYDLLSLPNQFILLISILLDSIDFMKALPWSVHMNKDIPKNLRIIQFTITYIPLCMI